MSNSRDWTKQTNWMRRHGVISAQFTADGQLTAVTLGPKPPPKQTDADKIPHKPSEREQLAERRRIALGAGAQLIRPQE